MKIPKGCRLTIESVYFDGLARPKYFIGVSISSVEAPDEGVTAYIIGHPLFLRLRLSLAIRRCIKMMNVLDSYQITIGN